MTPPPLPAADVPPAAAWGVVAGLGLFAALHARPPPAGLAGYAGLLGAAACLARPVIRAGDRWQEGFGMSRPRHPAAAWMAAGALLGALLGAAYRIHKGASAWPAALGWFAVLAPAIGAVEELTYRGFVQSGFRGYGRLAAVVLAAAGHAAYKYLLFAWRPGLAPADLDFLAPATFLAGILFGGLRQAARSAWPPVLAHAVFDILVYGALDQPPWWVWN